MLDVIKNTQEEFKTEMRHQIEQLRNDNVVLRSDMQQQVEQLRNDNVVLRMGMQQQGNQLRSMQQQMNQLRDEFGRTVTRIENRLINSLTDFRNPSTLIMWIGETTHNYPTTIGELQTTLEGELDEILQSYGLVIPQGASKVNYILGFLGFRIS